MKTIWITGSAVRLGREIALHFAGQGYFTWIHYRIARYEAESVLKAIEKQGGCGALIQGDLGQPKDIVRMVSEVKKKSHRLDILINNVGIYKPKDLLRSTPEEFEKTIQVNLSAAFRLIQSTLPLFPKSGGNIINVGYAGVESLTGTVHNTAYLISKTGLLILTKSFAMALGPRGIRVNMVSPGILSNSIELPRTPKDYVPLGRLGSLKDVVNALDFLTGEKAAYITGVNLDISGGYHLGLKSLEGDQVPRDVKKKSKR